MLITYKAKWKVNKEGNYTEIIFRKSFKVDVKFPIWEAINRQSKVGYYKRV